jgi:hypothetical protein
LTPRLKRVWRRINKANGSPSRKPTVAQAQYCPVPSAAGGNMT